MEKLPAFLKPYFWDVDFETLTVSKNPAFVVKRIIDRGRSSDLRWALRHYPLKIFKEVVLKSRDISRRTALIWANFFDLDHKSVICLNRPYTLWEQKDQRTFRLMGIFSPLNQGKI